MACSLFCSWLFSFWQDTTTPVGRCVMRTAESVVFTLWPPGPEDLNTSIFSSFGSIVTSIGSASGRTRTPAAEVWIRPCDSVAGHPLHPVHAALVLQVGPRTSPPRALTAIVTSLKPPRPVMVESRISVFQPCRSA